MKTIYFGSLRYKWICLRLSSIEKKLNRMYDLSNSLPFYEGHKRELVGNKVLLLQKKYDGLRAILTKYGTRETRHEHNSKIK